MLNLVYYFIYYIFMFYIINLLFIILLSVLFSFLTTRINYGKVLKNSIYK